MIDKLYLNSLPILYAAVAELADALDLGSNVFGRAGSIPVSSIYSRLAQSVEQLVNTFNRGEKMDPNLKGVLTELAIQQAFMQYGFGVSVPLNPASRYDMIVDAYGYLFKVQCKTANPFDDGRAFTFCAYSTNKLNGKYYKQSYGPNDVDLFATVYNNNVYVIPREQVTTRRVTMRLLPPANNQQQHIRYANDYRLDLMVNQFMLPYAQQ